MTEKPKLSTIKTLAMLKMEKNFIALEKGYLRQPYDDNITQPTSFLISRIHQEYMELVEAFDIHNIAGMKEECADVSNLVDYLFEKLSREEVQKPAVAVREEA